MAVEGESCVDGGIDNINSKAGAVMSGRLDFIIVLARCRITHQSPDTGTVGLRWQCMLRGQEDSHNIRGSFMDDRAILILLCGLAGMTSMVSDQIRVCKTIVVSENLVSI